MSPPKTRSVEGMLAARQHDSLLKQSATAAVINQFLLNGELISISAVAQAAGVSRNFMYSHPTLLHQLEAARKTQADSGAVARQRQPTHGSPGHAALKTDLAIARETINRLRHDLADLRHRHEHCLGQKLESQSPASEDKNPEAGPRMDQLTEENRSLTREVAALNHRINDLVDDLAAERRAAFS
jgi:hypothetical protein